ncbi:MAG: hypothetical protein KC416_06345 [Myxococcales bacterium]|nr:hypothetical protein [Myxococcales bacterium]
MIQNTIRFFLATALCGAFVVGCDEETTTNKTDSGTVDGGGGGIDSGTVTNACTNASDEAAIEAEYDGKTVTEIAKAEGQTCFLTGASEEEALRACVVSGINEKTDTALSAGCATCYSISVSCGAAACLTECLDTSTEAKSKACDACICGDNDMNRNCIDEFTACSGIPSSTCDGASDAGTDGGADAGKDAG